MNGHALDEQPNKDNQHQKRRARPTSLSLSVAGEWFQRGVKSLGGLGMSSWSTPNKRTPFSPQAILARPRHHDGSSSAPGEIQVPQLLQEGTWMTKVSGKKQKKMFLRLDPDLGHIIWHSKQPRIIPVENIKEIRSGPSTRLHRHHFQLAQEYENLWLTIIYILESHYKILHLIAPSEDILRMWDSTLRRLHAHRMQLMTGLGNIEERQRVWEKQYWKGVDLDHDQRLTFEEVEKLCKRLNINSPREDLLTWFKQADHKGRRYLDFEDFRRFVKLLKTRKEVAVLFNRLKGSSEHFDFDVFARFMRNDQKSNLPLPALHALFEKYSIPVSQSPPATPHPIAPREGFDFRPSALRSPLLLQKTFTPETLSSFLLSPDNAPFASPSHSSLPPRPPEMGLTTVTATTSSLPNTKHDMTHPLSSYFISSSHNTYLVGHQLVGSSTVEGYIRALLAGCRSVEIDIFDGSGSEDSTISNTSPNLCPGASTTSLLNEPMVFHGHTLTTKVPLRQVCQAIMKYGFIASPYPIIISAENHCSIQGQEQIAKIMIEEFGDALVRYPIDGPDMTDVMTRTVSHTSPIPAAEEGNWIGKGKIAQLPSPEELKGRILLKTKNLMLGKSESVHVSKGGSLTSSESDVDPSGSASESDIGIAGVSTMFGGLYRRESDRIGNKGRKKTGEGNNGDIVREGLIRATSMIQRVRSVGRSTAPSLNSTASNLSGPVLTSTASMPVNISAGIPSSTPPLSSPQVTSLPLVASPPPLTPPLPPASVPVPIPIPRNRSFSSVHPHTHTHSLASSPASASSFSSSMKKPASLFEGSTIPSSPQLGAPSSYTGSSSLLSSSLGAASNSGGGALSLVRRTSSRTAARQMQRPKPKMSMALVALLVYTVGVKCRGFRKSNYIYIPSDDSGSVSDAKSTKSTKSKDKLKDKEKEKGDGVGGDEERQLYAPEHVFSLSENGANKVLRTSMLDFIEHTEGHLVRVYPRGTRMRSTNFEPHRYWSAGCQLVAINWQTFDLGYVINHAMFQRNGRCGYVLKPPALRHPSKPEHNPETWRKKRHYLNITIISAQQLPRVKVKDGSGHEVLGTERERDKEKDKDTYEEGKEREGKEAKEKEGKTVDPYVEVSLHVPEWTYNISPSVPSTSSSSDIHARYTTTPSKTHTSRTPTIKNNGFNPIWNHALQISFDAPTQQGMLDLIFLRLLVRQESSGGVGPYYPDAETLAVCCVSLGELREGYRHLPLYDATLSQYLFSTLFVKASVV